MSDQPLFNAPRKPIPPSRQYSVRQVNELIRGALNQHLPATLHVIGEVGDLSRRGSGHLYFALKDANSELRCGMWRSTAVKSKPLVGWVATHQFAHQFRRTDSSSTSSNAS